MAVLDLPAQLDQEASLEALVSRDPKDPLLVDIMQDLRKICRLICTHSFIYLLCLNPLFPQGEPGKPGEKGPSGPTGLRVSHEI